jgi:hypothetical protein
LAVPDCPKLVDQVIDVTPTLSLAVPVKTIVAAEVETEVDDGVTMVSEGGVVSVGLADALCLVTVTACDTRLIPSVALTVIELDPAASGIAAMFQEDDPWAEPEPWLLDQVTEAAAFPPDVVPERLIVLAVVIAGGAATVRVSGAAGVVGAGVGVGAGGGVGVGVGVGVGAVVLAA